ncbi:MAG: plasmid pRiA4b ORF-3 family protein, partial [Dehalococcoidia bacterium]
CGAARERTRRSSSAASVESGERGAHEAAVVEAGTLRGMSFLNRARKPKTRNGAMPLDVVPPAPAGQDQCDCPACAEGFDPRQLIGELTTSFVDLLESEDPLDAELAGAAFVSMVAGAGEDFEDEMLNGLIPALETRAGAEGLVLLLAIGAVAAGPVGKAAATAADGLIAAGIPRPGWAGELDQPVTVADCQRLSDEQGSASILACSFHRAGRSHAVVLRVDHLDCGAAGEILLLDADNLPAALEMMRSSGRDIGLDIRTEALDPAEFRWQVENALDERAVHDEYRIAPDQDEPVDADDDGPDYHTMAVLLRARMESLPASSKPKESHSDTDTDGLTALQELARLVGLAGPVGAPALGVPLGRAPAAKLPKKRKRSDGPAPVYQIKVGLRGAKPPIWRRLEVPADISLARLHAVVQIAFDWYDGHMHVFETPYGDFGVADPELGHRSEAPVRLEQVAPGEKSKIRYTYDFGDDWEHEILVEKVLERDKAAKYPRCTGGRRAAPPEDCGGIWGYSWLVEVLADPAHPDHDDRLEWLGLDDPAEFDPAEFDAAAITEALAGAR